MMGFVVRRTTEPAASRAAVVINAPVKFWLAFPLSFILLPPSLGWLYHGCQLPTGSARALVWSAATGHRFPTGRHVCQFQSAVMPAHSK